MATRSSVLAWRIPGTGEPGGLPSMGHRVGHDWSVLAVAVDLLRYNLHTIKFTLLNGKKLFLEYSHNCITAITIYFRTISSPPKETQYPLAITLYFLFSSTPENPQLFSVSINVLILNISYKRNQPGIRWLVFSISIMFSRFIHHITYIKILLHFIAK